MFIREGWLQFDGEKVTRLGTQISESSQVELLPQTQTYQSHLVTIPLNKPIGYVSGQPEKGYQPAASLIAKGREYRSTQFPAKRKIKWPIKRLAPVGRLDFDSGGLLVFTQDGRIAQKLIRPNSDVEKEYLVWVDRSVKPKQINRLTYGLC